MDRPANTGPEPRQQWAPLSLLRERYRANLLALAKRDPDLAARIDAAAPPEPSAQTAPPATTVPGTWFVAADGHRVSLGRADAAGTIVPCENPVTPHIAECVATKLFPARACNEPVVVAGIDQGWLWNALYHLRVSVPHLPGHRPPLFLLARDTQRLRAVLHIQDWQRLLADPRVRIITGLDAAHQLAEAITRDVWVARPRLSLTLDSAIWAEDDSFEKLMRRCADQLETRLRRARATVDRRDAAVTSRDLAARLAGRKPLRILGISSIYAGPLHHSMQDWLDGMRSLGHTTRLITERESHEITGPVPLAEAVADFQPDLILLINHYRNQLGVLGAAVPCVMWVRDAPPAVLRPQAGAAQRRRDYVIGSARQHFVSHCGYVADRFLSCGPAVSEHRFVAAAPVPADQARFACDVSFVGDGFATPRALLEEHIASQQSPFARPLLEAIYQRLETLYSAGRSVAQTPLIARLIEQALADQSLSVEQPQRLLEIFTQKINRALYQEQSLLWLAELGVDLRIYGQGWQAHPTLKQFARGPVQPADLPAICRASAINLHVCPFGSVTQPVLEGICSGGFFLLRETTADRIERLTVNLHAWGTSIGAASGAEFFAKATARVRATVDEIALLSGEHPAIDMTAFWTRLCENADAGWTAAASTLFPHFDDVAFANKPELAAKLHLFLKNPGHRAAIASQMRARIVQAASYTSASRRLLAMIAEDISRQDHDLSAVA